MLKIYSNELITNITIKNCKIEDLYLDKTLFLIDLWAWITGFTFKQNLLRRIKTTIGNPIYGISLWGEDPNKEAKDIIIKDNIFDDFKNEYNETSTTYPIVIETSEYVNNLTIMRNEFKNIRALHASAKNGYGIQFYSEINSSQQIKVVDNHFHIDNYESDGVQHYIYTWIYI